MTVLGSPERADIVRELKHADLAERRQEDASFIGQSLLTRSAQEWEQLLNAAHVPAARIKPIEAALLTEQIQQRPVLQATGPEVTARVTPVAGLAMS